jgi:hypothetical protein
MKFVSFNSNTTGVTCGEGTANPFGAPVFIPVFSRVRVAGSLVFCVVFCRSLFVYSFVLFLLACLFTLITLLYFKNVLEMWNITIPIHSVGIYSSENMSSWNINIIVTTMWQNVPYFCLLEIVMDISLVCFILLT